MYVAQSVITESIEKNRLRICAIVIDVILKRKTHYSRSSKKLGKLGGAK